LLLVVCVAVVVLGTSGAYAADVVTPQDVLHIKLAVAASISPDGRWVVYNVRVPREPADKAGADYRELHVVSTKDGSVRPFVTGKVTVNAPRFSPDGSQIAFRMKRGEKAKTQVWVIPSDGGEARQVTDSKTNVSTFRWHPDGKQIGYITATPPTKREKKLKDKGYGFVFYEENLKHRNLYLVDVGGTGQDAEARQLTKDTTVWSFEFAPGGETIAVSASEKNLIDHRYAFRKIYLLDVSSGGLTQLTNNPGKLGNFAFNPDGSRLAYAAARDRSDHAVSQAYVINTSGGEALNVTPDGFRGHIDWVAWRNKDTVLYRAGEGVWNTLNVVRTDGKQRKQILEPADAGIIFGTPTFTKNFKYFAMTGSTPEDPSDVYLWTPGKSPRRLTDLNPWAADRDLGGQEVIHYPARDGLDIEGLLIYPVGYQQGKRYPLVVFVHGGPEAHYSNGWQTYYSRPAQLLSGKGYFVFMPNYRSSTGYGVDFTKNHLGDPAGKEFDDIADGIDFLVDSGLVDRERVGLGGGSYGGFAAAWFSSYYTQYVRAVCMFVGISDLVSKRGTTDIPYEELYVHSGKKLEDMWQRSIERSPIYYAHQSESAVLIFGGSADTRVHPSQSLEYYRRLKMNNHPAVRLVRYPGEGHGNAKQPGRIDVLHRTIQWYDWYVMDRQPLDGPMPPLDISDSYGLELPDE
jgi:dipeptidyl aminopeptidase/acylaminoacyl peptidase